MARPRTAILYAGPGAIAAFGINAVVARQAGAMTTNQIVAWTTQALARAPA